MIKKVLAGLFLGIVVTLFVMQEDPWVCDGAARAYVKMFSSVFDCTMSYGSVKKLNLFVPSIELNDVVVIPNDQQQEWQWQCKVCTTRFSWMHLLLFGMIDMHVGVEDLQAQSLLANNKLCIAKHIQKLVNSPQSFIPIFLKTVCFKNSQINFCNNDNSLRGTFSWNSESKQIRQVMRSSCTITDAHITSKDRTFFCALKGDIHCDMHSVRNELLMKLHCSGSVQLPRDNNHKTTCFIAGTWDYGRGKFSIKDTGGRFSIDPIYFIKSKGGTIIADCTAAIELADLWCLMRNKKSAHLLGGTLHTRVRTNLNDVNKGFYGHCIFENVRYNHIPLFSDLKISCHRNKSGWYGGITSRAQEDVQLCGGWNFQDIAGNGGLVLTNVRKLAIPSLTHWQLASRAFSLQCSFDKKQGILGKYRIAATHPKMETKKFDGEFIAHSGGISFTGAINDNTYCLEGVVQPRLWITKLLYQDQDQKPLLGFNFPLSDTKNFTSTVQFSFIRKTLLDLCNYDVPGEGVFFIDGSIGGKNVKASVSLRDGNIRLPETYNFINGFDARVQTDLRTRTVEFEGIVMQLHKGKITSNRAVVRFDKDYSTDFIHAPFIINSCLLNMKRDLFTIASGSLNFVKKDNKIPFLKGSVILERSQLNENIFSQEFQKKLGDSSQLLSREGADIACDIYCITKYPIPVITPFLQTRAKIGLHIGNTIKKPELSGTIELLSGALLFPYRPLHITKGTVLFSPHGDPQIELIAKNTIKKYSVTLQATGSLSNHHVMLESTPQLTEEQIIALLLLGSQRESLNVVMPALVMNNVANILFASDQSPLKLSNHFNKLLKPFKYIHLVPSFSDQTGRGGLRGAIEIDVSDRWRALIQKNFSLTEDTRFEVEYDLSDDISLRAVRDERRDISAEIEMRWKF